MWPKNKKIPAFAKLSTQFAAPIIVCCTAALLLFYSTHARHQVDLLRSAEKISNHLLKSYAQAPATYSDKALEQISTTLLDLGYYSNVAICDENFGVIRSFGLPANFPDNMKTILENGRLDNNQYRFSRIPMENSAGGATQIIVTIDKTRFTLSSTRFLLGLVIIAALSLAFIVAPAIRIRYNIDKPLEELKRSLKLFSKEANHSIELKHPGIFSELVETFNSALGKQSASAANTQDTVDAATQEIRETLESVEVQNIELDIARKNAIELNQIKSDFLKKTSQDLRTPLNGILGFSELLKKSSLAAEQFEYVSTIEDSTKGMLAIVNDIQDFSRLESGNLTLENKAIDLIGVVEHAILLQAPLRQEKNINLYCHFDHDIPHHLLGDPLRIQQLLSNLISSATKFVGASYIAISVNRISSSTASATFQFNIRSDGRVADSFQNAAIKSLQDSSQSDALIYSNTDIGLSIARGLVQHMRGEIGFESNRDRECNFWFRIPLDVDSSGAESHNGIDPTFQVNALVFANNDLSYQEITSRLIRLGAKNQRAETFSDIIELSEKLKQEWQTKARFFPIAIIEAQTSQQTIDKIMLTQTLSKLTQELNIPTIAIAPSGQLESMQKLLANLDLQILQRPIQTHKFSKAVLERLGILNTKQSRLRKSNTTQTEVSDIKILLVDDNPANVKLTKALLRDFRAESTVASTGEEAISLFKQNQFDLVLMDIQLPDMDGYSVTGELRKLEGKDRRTPIVALTAHSVQDNKSKLLLSGMDDFLSKPTNTSKIGEVLDRWVKQGSPRIDTTEESSNEVPDIQSNASPVNISDSLSLAKNDASLARDMLAMLIESLPDEKDKITNAMSDNNITALHEVIHRIHGGACYCGVPALRKACSKTDVNLKNDITETLEEEVDEILDEINELITWNEAHDLNALFQ